MNRIIVFGLGLSSAGCAVQLGGGGAWAPREKETAPLARAAVQYMSVRVPNTLVGVRTTLVDDAAHLSVHSVTGMAGLAIPFGKSPRMIFESTFDLGGGKPVTNAYDGTGGYARLSALLGMRVLGDADTREEYQLASGFIDVVIAARGGAWAPPEHAGTSRVLPDLSAELALRATVFSDAISTKPLATGEDPPLGRRP